MVSWVLLLFLLPVEVTVVPVDEVEAEEEELLVPFPPGKGGGLTLFRILYCSTKYGGGRFPRPPLVADERSLVSAFVVVVLEKVALLLPLLQAIILEDGELPAGCCCDVTATEEIGELELLPPPPTLLLVLVEVTVQLGVDEVTRLFRVFAGAIALLECRPPLETSDKLAVTGVVFVLLLLPPPPVLIGGWWW